MTFTLMKHQAEDVKWMATRKRVLDFSDAGTGKTGKHIVDFAQRMLRTVNCAVIYKHTAPDNNVIKVEKPPITAVELNRVDASEFAQSFLEKTTSDIEPHFIDFKKVIKSNRLTPQVKLPDPDGISRLSAR